MCVSSFPVSSWPVQCFLSCLVLHPPVYSSRLTFSYFKAHLILTLNFHTLYRRVLSCYVVLPHVVPLYCVQAAGVQVGDLLVSVDNIVAETPRLLAQGLKESGLSQSGKLIVVKVRLRR